jgi:hypothetical protein
MPRPGATFLSTNHYALVFKDRRAAGQPICPNQGIETQSLKLLMYRAGRRCQVTKVHVPPLR